MIVVDTHVWFWLVTEPGRLSPPAAEAVDAAEKVGVAAISCWEIAMLVAKGRLLLDRPTSDWLKAALAGSVLLPLDPDVAELAARLAMHGDPADRLSVATALTQGATLVTKDDAIRRSGLVQTIW